LGRKRALVVYFSGGGHTEWMAQQIFKGMEKPRISVDLRTVLQCEIDELAKVDALVIGSPTYFSNVAWQVKKLIDESIVLYGGRKLRGKIGGCFTSAGTERDGKECIRMMEVTFGFHHGMQMIPGIVGTSLDDKEKLAQECRSYGREIASRLQKPSVH